ncbi:type II secretion system protein GspG [Cerasicoccus arenae]|uniref:Type II secretion system protein GspG C-terminal domain-containing protein n=1 Tax=Cerasicoccus arenae TaxID=424488 RepID=A0A8J3DFK7_9BACT|nr:type II secretion system protein GspG [Cerasicoccus arenae]MBK1859315.1 type II secretion system protein GspG [Cerasicoccus arenae]GHB93981.1 hypothetical protein GCM10007047_07000 [Cerasicoccus arenae]
MKFSLIPLLALLCAATPGFAADDLTALGSGDDATPIGRFQVADVGNIQVLLDTATGRVWQVSKRGPNIALTPVPYVHAEGLETMLPDYEPPTAKSAPKADPGKTAERIIIAQEFVREDINAPIMTYAAQLGEFPPNLPSLSANLRNHPQWRGPYVRQTLIDPWGNTYRYLYPGQQNKETYDVWSLGPDGVPSEDDIGNW